MSAPAVRKRILSYDAFRGFLVLGMVMYHVLLHFYTGPIFDGFFYWVAVGFMLFLGIVAGRFLWHKPRKTFWLAMKIMFIFFLLNLPKLLISDENFIWHDFLTGNQDFFAFDILWPMSWVLFFISIYGFLVNKKSIQNDISQIIKYSAFFILLGLILGYDFGFSYRYNFLFLLFGLLGFFLGRCFDLDRVLSEIKWGGRFLLLSWLIVSFWLFYEVKVFHFVALGQVLALYLLLSPWLERFQIFIFLGRYSLIIYVGHIVLIRLLLWGF